MLIVRIRCITDGTRSVIVLAACENMGKKSHHPFLGHPLVLLSDIKYWVCWVCVHVWTITSTPGTTSQFPQSLVPIDLHIQHGSMQETVIPITHS